PKATRNASNRGSWACWAPSRFTAARPGDTAWPTCGSSCADLLRSHTLDASFFGPALHWPTSHRRASRRKKSVLFANQAPRRASIRCTTRRACTKDQRRTGERAMKETGCLSLVYLASAASPADVWAKGLPAHPPRL